MRPRDQNGSFCRAPWNDETKSAPRPRCQPRDASVSVCAGAYALRRSAVSASAKHSEGGDTHRHQDKRRWDRDLYQTTVAENHVIQKG